MGLVLVKMARHWVGTFAPLAVDWGVRSREAVAASAVAFAVASGAGIFGVATVVELAFGTGNSVVGGAIASFELGVGFVALVARVLAIVEVLVVAMVVVAVFGAVCVVVAVVAVFELSTGVAFGMAVGSWPAVEAEMDLAKTCLLVWGSAQHTLLELFAFGVGRPTRNPLEKERWTLVLIVVAFGQQCLFGFGLELCRF